MRPVIGRAATLSKNRQDDQYGPEPDADCLATHSGVTGHYEAVLCRPDANLRARSEVQLVQDVLDVCGYGPVGDHQPFGDLAIAEPLCDEPRHLPLAWSQRVQKMSRRCLGAR